MAIKLSRDLEDRLRYNFPQKHEMLPNGRMAIEEIDRNIETLREELEESSPDQEGYAEIRSLLGLFESLADFYEIREEILENQ